MPERGLLSPARHSFSPYGAIDHDLFVKGRGDLDLEHFFDRPTVRLRDLSDEVLD